ncbi:MAG: hypothetical protein DWQ19_10635 [Crenarchaeota archaeon]|nr:MAG: hypothetical protein DWQ19_10635 [Thermoproteota archaeon]
MDVQLGLSSFYNTDCNKCPDEFGCISGVCADVLIKRHDTKPPFKYVVYDSDNSPLDLTDTTLVLEASIWSKAKLKAAIDADDTYFQLADNIGFQQIITGDIIVMDRVRLPEYMLVTGFDETNCLIQVQRGYNGTEASSWKKGTSMRVFRTMGAPAVIESVLSDVIQEDGSTATDQLVETRLVYNWEPQDTCTPGCYWLEFKLLKMTEVEMSMLSTGEISNISFTPSTLSNADFGCCLGDDVEWVRRFPHGEGFLVQILDSPTKEI